VSFNFCALPYFLLAKLKPLNINIGSDRFAMFNKERGIAMLRPLDLRANWVRW
jgi:hypothetical protein